MRAWWIVTMVLAPVAARASTPAEVAQSYEAAILPADNAYGSPSEIRWDGGSIRATTKCGGYVAQVLRGAYASVTTSVLRGLTGSGSPTSKQWSDALEASASYTDGSGTFQLHARETMSRVTRGDVFASEYVVGSASGHTMIIGSASLDASAVATTIPGVPLADRWLVMVHDSTSSPHGTTDSRTRTQDAGIGSGWIYVYADPTNGVIVGWTWSTASAVTYQTTDPMAPHYRPAVVGYLSGPGI